MQIQQNKPPIQGGKWKPIDNDLQSYSTSKVFGSSHWLWFYSYQSFRISLSLANNLELEWLMHSTDATETFCFGRKKLVYLGTRYTI